MATGRWENSSHGVSLSKLPIFLVFLEFFIFSKCYISFKHIFICIEEILLLYIRDLDFITVQTNIETQIWSFLSLFFSRFISSFSYLSFDW